MKISRKRTVATSAAALAVVALLAVPATVSAVTTTPDPVAAPSALVAAQSAVTAAASVSAPSMPYSKITSARATRMRTHAARLVAVKKAAAKAGAASKRVVTSSSTSQLSQARSILRGLIAKHPILRGTTVTIGRTPGGYQAVAYYTSGRIVVSPSHSASLSRILSHEVWHVIDWRDNGRIDWGENVPR